MDSIYTIRLLAANEAEKFFEIIDNNRSRLEDFFAGTVAKTRTLADTKGYVAEVMQRMENKQYYPYIVLNQNTGNIIGLVDVKNIDWSIPKAELGCFFDEAYTGKGIAAYALMQVIAKLKADHGLIKLFLRTHQANETARRLAEKCGFEVEGVIRKDYKTTKGELVDLVYYGLVLD